MPFFNEASRIYTPVEVDLLRSCFTYAAVILEESDRNYSASELASCVMMLYEHGLRDRNYLCELAARLAHQKYVVRHDMTAMHANSNDAEGTFS
jgi:hypothetical protein